MQAYVMHYLYKKHLQKQNNSRRVYGEKITRKMANIEMKYRTKLQKKIIQKNREDSGFPQQCDSRKIA